MSVQIINQPINTFGQIYLYCPISQYNSRWFWKLNVQAKQLKCRKKLSKWTFIWSWNWKRFPSSIKTKESNNQINADEFVNIDKKITTEMILKAHS